MSYKIYCCTDKENGYKYIGVTYKDVKKRLTEHITEALHSSRKSPFKQAIRNGRKFDTCILMDNIEKLSDALEYEKYYINLYRTCIKFKDCAGYNGTVGGEYSSNTDDREFIFKFDKQYNFIEAYPDIIKLSKILNIDTNILYDNLINNNYIEINDYLYTYYDYKIPRIENNKSKILNNEINYGYGINQYDLNGKFLMHFKSGEDAARAVGTYSSSIVKVCKGKHNSHKGYIWRYAKSYTDKNNLIITNSDNIMSNSNNKREIVQMDLDGNVINIFESAHDASRKLNISLNNIRTACNDINLSAGGYKWKFRNESTAIKHRRKIAQIDANDNIVNIYKSMMEASNITGISRSGIYDCCAGRGKTAGGFRWKYVD